MRSRGERTPKKEFSHRGASQETKGVIGKLLRGGGGGTFQKMNHAMT